MANGMLMLVNAGREMMDWTDYKYKLFFLLLYELCDDETRIWSKYYRISLSIIYMKVHILT